MKWMFKNNKTNTVKKEDEVVTFEVLNLNSRNEEVLKELRSPICMDCYVESYINGSTGRCSGGYRYLTFRISSGSTGELLSRLMERDELRKYLSTEFSAKLTIDIQDGNHHILHIIKNRGSNEVCTLFLKDCLFRFNLQPLFSQLGLEYDPDKKYLGYQNLPNLPFTREPISVPQEEAQLMHVTVGYIS